MHEFLNQYMELMMGDGNAITSESPVDVDKASKWTIFLLVDLRVVFIITYVYVTVVNLISTTANGEASEDIHSTKLFTVTSLPGHANVNVSFIDDAILWNCRDRSVTKHYYKGLYWMLISAFSGTMIAFISTKFIIIYGAKFKYRYLWWLAVIECLQNMKVDTKHVENIEIFKENCKKQLDYVIESREDLLRKTRIDHNDECCLWCYDICTISSLCCSVFCLVTGIVLTFLFYDLHPLSCIHGEREKYINYDAENESVEIHFASSILLAQKVVGIILPVLALAFVINAIFFYLCNVQMVKILAKYVKKELQNSNDVTDGNENDSCCSCCTKPLGNCLCFFVCV